MFVFRFICVHVLLCDRMIEALLAPTRVSEPVENVCLTAFERSDWPVHCLSDFSRPTEMQPAFMFEWDQVKSMFF